MITKKTKIAIGLVKALNGDASAVFSVDYASDNEVYQVAAKLVKKGILGSNKGRSGGYYIKSNSITLADVMQATGELKHDCVFEDLALQGLYSVVLSAGNSVDTHARAKTQVVTELTEKENL
jgi:DNA-binding IscR family transcriptional regulator